MARPKVDLVIGEAIVCPGCGHKDRGGDVMGMEIIICGLRCSNCQADFDVEYRKKPNAEASTSKK